MMSDLPEAEAQGHASRVAPGPCPGRPRGGRYTVGVTSRPARPAKSRQGGCHNLGIARDQEPARRARGRHRDRQGRRPHRRPERGARGHGAERLRQVDARLRAHGPSGLRDHRGRDPARRRERRRDGRRRARAARALPGLPVPVRRSRRDRRELPALRRQRDPQGARTAARTTRSPIKEFRTEPHERDGRRSRSRGSWPAAT